MQATKKQKAEFRRKFMKSVKKANNLGEELSKQMIALAEEMRSAIQAELINLGGIQPGTRLNADQIRFLRDKAAEHVQRFRAQATALLQDGVETANLAAKTAAQELLPLLEIGSSPLLFIDPPIIAMAAEHTALLIQKISNETLDKVNGTLTLSFLGEKDAFDTMRDIDTALGTSLESGVTARAETIARTEFTRFYNGAEQGSFEIIADALTLEERELLDKEWLSAQIPTSRDSHADPFPTGAHGQIVQIDQPFIVDGEPLMFPGDPGGSPGNTINCLCTMVINTDRLLDFREDNQEQGIAPR